jgi:hypothetical protein
MAIKQIIIKHLGLYLLFTVCALSSNAQTNGPLTLSAPNTTGNFSSNTSIHLTAGFNAIVPFSATIQAIDCIPLTTAPSLNRNYTITNVTRIPGITSETQLTGRGTCELMQSIQYYDGIGRPLQSIQVMASPVGHDIVQPQAYDQYGRELKKYLPYVPATGTIGTYRTNAVSTDQKAFYNAPRLEWCKSLLLLRWPIRKPCPKTPRLAERCNRARRA